MDKLITAIFLLSPSLLLVIYLQMQQTQKLDNQVDNTKIEFKKDQHKFDEDFYFEKSQFSDNKEAKEYYLNKSKDAQSKLLKIEEAKKKAELEAKKLKEKSQKTFEKLEKSINDLDSKKMDSEFDNDNFDF